MPGRRLNTPLSREAAADLRAGDLVLLSGLVYTARDAAHQRLARLLDLNLPLPFDPEGAVLYYVGPTPAPPGRVIGSAGPTTSGRMDGLTPRLHALGLRATIGKGPRGPQVLKALQEHTAVYFGATGGAGALLSTHITEAAILAFPDLGTEAIRRLRVRELPLLVINDCLGGELYALPNPAARPRDSAYSI
ncbi:MAG: fumarate hydratase C-terminal domain-containing protein [Deltaproteobacteria bacterium]|jgi:fumarate hydratase subunit beta|nr:fumarate hydratase C-terminal domain-containing protein [Deltaproteobacteria bacterium]